MDPILDSTVPDAAVVTTGSRAGVRIQAMRLLPGGAFLAYWILTELLFFWGPWDYPIGAGEGRLIAFLVAVNIAFAVGYLAGTRRRSTTAPAVRVGTVVLVAAACELLLLFPTSWLDSGHWIPRPGAALSDLGTVYTQSLALRDRTTPYVNYVRILVAPLLATAIPLGVFFWQRLRPLTRIVFALSVVGTIVLYVSIGANAGAAHWMVLFPWFVVAGHLSGVQRLSWRGWIASGCVMVLSIALFASLFAATMMARKGSYVRIGVLPNVGATLEGPSTAVPASGRTPATSATRRLPPSAARVGVDGLISYLTQGYFAVYLSLQEPFVPMFGIGNSVFLQRQAARLLHAPQILEMPYPVRIEAHGWNAEVYWATIYPWIASDVGFPGTVVVMFLIGYLVARVWVDVLGGGNVAAVAFFGQILILLYYVPAHNRVMHSGEGVTAFWGLLAVWLLTSRRAAAVDAATRS
jgi:hypothetical protein